jgi:hypothetical protein
MMQYFEYLPADGNTGKIWKMMLAISKKLESAMLDASSF